VLGDQALELARDLLQRARAALVGEDEQEVAQQLLAAAQQVLDCTCARARVELRVAQQLAQLRHLGLRLHDLRQVVADGPEPVLVARRLEQRRRIHAVNYRHVRSFRTT
jgi:hypothetical protein